MRDRLIQLLATHLKLDYLLWNKDSVDDEKIFKDLAEMSGWKISLNPDQVKLMEGRELMRICNGNAAKNLSQESQQWEEKPGRWREESAECDEEESEQSE